MKNITFVVKWKYYLKDELRTFSIFFTLRFVFSFHTREVCTVTSGFRSMWNQKAVVNWTVVSPDWRLLPFARLLLVQHSIHTGAQWRAFYRLFHFLFGLLTQGTSSHWSVSHFNLFLNRHLNRESKAIGKAILVWHRCSPVTLALLLCTCLPSYILAECHMSHADIPRRNFDESASHIFLSKALLLLHIDMHTFGPHLQTCKINYMEVMLKYDH